MNDKPRHRRTRTPLESFGPEIMAALLKGGKEEVRLHTTYRLGVVFRSRVHRLRTEMHAISHPEYPLAARTKIQLLWGKRAGLPDVPETKSSKGVTRPVNPEAPAILVLSPRDSEFAGILQKAGIQTDLPDDPLAELAKEPKHD